MPRESLWVAFAYTHAYCNGDSNCHSYGYGNWHGDRNSHTYADNDANTDPVRRKMHSHAAAASHSTASPIAPVAASLCEA